MTMYEIIIAGGLAMICLFLLFKRNSQSSKASKQCQCHPPGPKKTLLMGNFKDVDSDNFHKSLYRLFKEYGPIVHLRLLKRNIVVLNSASAIRKAFQDEEYKELLNDKVTGFFGQYLVYGHQDVLLGPYCERTFRLKDVMHKAIGPSLHVTNILRECRTLVERLETQGTDDFEPAEIVETLLAEVFTIMIAGESKDQDSEMMWDFIHWSNKLINPSVESVLKNFPFLRHVPCKYKTLFDTAKQKRDKLLCRLLDECRATHKEGVVRGFVDICLNLQREEIGPSGNSWLSDDMIRASIMDVLGGGVIATTNTILAGILNLLNNRKCLDKMWEEIKTVVKPGQEIIPLDRKRMHYCQAVIMETQRYSSLVPIISHYCSQKDTEFEGYNIKKETMVWGNIWAAHHDDSVWTEPWTFMPERFLDEQGKLLSPDHQLRKALIPYGVGKRYCVGSDFAVQRIFCYITNIIQHFDILPPKEGELLSNDPNLFDAGAVLQIHRYKCRMVPRSEK